MGKSNLLKEAIADAKAVRETALANARMRMEEAFTPRLQSMISAKLQNEMEGEDEEEIVDEPVDAEPVDAESEAEAEIDAPVEEPVADEMSTEEPVDADVEPEADGEIEAPVEEPVEIETEPEVDIEVEPSEDEIEEEGYELDLESIIKELENESNMDDEMEEPMFTEEESEEEEELYESDNVEAGMKTKKDVTPNLTASAQKAGGGEQTSPDRGKPFSTEKGGEHPVSPDLNKVSKNAIYEEEGECEGEDEEINLDEILRELEEEDLSASIPDELPDASNPFKSVNEQLKNKVSSLTKDLKEHRNVIKFLKSKLNEVNLLNAKLLFTSKLFKSNNMSNNEKMKVIESFDRAKTLREVKLVYSTIAESVNAKSSIDSKKVAKKITESIGGASKPVASTKPDAHSKKVIIEGIVSEEGAERLKKLAGIKVKK